MIARTLLLFVALALFSLSSEAFAPVPSFVPRASLSLDACRTNAKKEKRKRNRENMRKFKTGGKKGLSARKQLKKIQASSARQEESEFIAKCFITVPAPGGDD